MLGFPGGSVIRSPPANAEDSGSIPGPGRHHVLWSSQAHAPQPRSQQSRAYARQQQKPPQGEAQAAWLESSPCSLQLEKSSHSNEDPAQPAKNK